MRRLLGEMLRRRDQEERAMSQIKVAMMDVRGTANKLLEYINLLQAHIAELLAENDRLRAELAAERERCAQIAEGDSWHGTVATIPSAIAAAIRRGEP